MQSPAPSTTLETHVTPSSASSPLAEEAKQADSSSDPDELIGRCFNDTYQIESLLGQGGAGRVYKARHVRISTKVYALKVLHAEHSRDPQQLARFQREAETAATLSHPNVVGVFDVGRTQDGYSYLVCEFLQGTDLDAYLEHNRKLDVDTAVRMGLQICEALETAHAQNIIHRDLKPQNVFLLSGPDGTLSDPPTIKLVDFGLSRFLDHTDAQLTKTGTLMGTPAFMAPEQAMGQRGDHQVDVYGVGVILYAALTGRAPFIEETVPAMLVAVMTEEAPRPRKLAPEIPEALEVIIQRAMAKQPEERYPDISALKEALQSVISNDGTKHHLTPVRSRMSSSLKAAEEAYQLRTSRLRLVFYGLVMVLMAVAFVTSAVSGLELFTGPFQFGTTELILVVLGICGTILTPVILAFRHFRRTIWSNSAKVISTLARLRISVLAALIAYGVAAICVRFFDDFLGRMRPGGLFVQSPGLGWEGFTWILPGIALLAASMAYIKQRIADSPKGSTRLAWLGTPLFALTLLGSSGLLLVGLEWRNDDLTAKRQRAQQQARAAAAERRSTKEPQEPEQPALADDTTLAQAVELGVDGLLPLSEKYPQDPRVLERLLLEFASRATGFADAMVTAKRLVAVAPEFRDSPTLGLMVRRAANTPGNASDRAFELMKRHLGSTGPDLLYQIANSGQKASTRAQEALSKPEVRAKMSPALRIALELEEAQSCEDRLALLPRAKYLGDLRSSSLLAPLAEGTQTGCGKWENRPCPAPCEKQAAEYLDAVTAIRLRESGTSEL